LRNANRGTHAVDVVSAMRVRAGEEVCEFLPRTKANPHDLRGNFARNAIGKKLAFAVSPKPDTASRRTKTPLRIAVCVNIIRAETNAVAVPSAVSRELRSAIDWPQLIAKQVSRRLHEARPPGRRRDCRCQHTWLSAIFLAQEI